LIVLVRALLLLLLLFLLLLCLGLFLRLGSGILLRQDEVFINRIGLALGLALGSCITQQSR
jgi:hypothetical protein